MKKTILAALLALPSLAVAQEMLKIEEKTFAVADIDSITIEYTRPTMADVLAEHAEYSLFSEALEITGLADTLAMRDKFKDYFIENPAGSPGSSFASGHYYYPTQCKVKFTLFAVDNDAFRQLGITNLQSLKAKCAEWYGGAGDWYDYPGKGTVAISTGDDYTNPMNVLNMFVRYHILKAGLPYSKLVYAYGKYNEYWNYAFGGEPQDYYETLLPHTLLKVWQPLYHNTGDRTNIWVNRYRKNNTLTDEVGTFGSEAMHPLVDTGALVRREKSDITALNGYIHSISKPLVYSNDVAYGVLNERLRVDVEDMMPEIANNELKLVTQNVLAAMNSSNDGVMARIPAGFIDNMVLYNDNIDVAYYSIGAWRAWGSQQLALWTEDNMDLALRLPPVPSGTYELRLVYFPATYFPVVQPYLGTSADTTSMVPMGIPFDMRYPNSDLVSDREATGYLRVGEFSDYGVASDRVLRNNGYMRAPASYARGLFNEIREPISNPQVLIHEVHNSCRYEEGYGTSSLRKIIGTMQIDQQKEYWLRLKQVNTTDYLDRMILDYIELVPTSVVNNATYTEDWY